MTGNSTKYVLIAILVLVILSVLGFFIGKSLINKPSDTETPVKTEQKTSEKFEKLTTDFGQNINNLIANDPEQIKTIMDCKNGICENNPSNNPPYQWVRYAQFAQTKSSGDFSTLLNDLNTYPASSFRSRLYQYGEIINEDLVKYSDFKTKYLAILDEIHALYITETVQPYRYYTNEAPPEKNLLAGSGSGSNSNLPITVMLESSKALAFGNAYIMNGGQKYLSSLISQLSYTHDFVYYDMPAQSGSNGNFKTSSCYAILADTKAYEITKEDLYLAYFKTLLSSGEFESIFSASPDLNYSQFNSPMMLLPCLDAVEQLETLDTDSGIDYDKLYNLVLNYIDSNNFVKGEYLNIASDEKDLNSTAWLAKITASKLLNK